MKPDHLTILAPSFHRGHRHDPRRSKPIVDVSQQRVERIRALLEQALSPEHLEVIDESHLHVGHPGARDGRGHFRVRIAATGLEGLSRLQCHRRIYAALGDMMQTDIHALSIENESSNDL